MYSCILLYVIWYYYILLYITIYDYIYIYTYIFGHIVCIMIPRNLRTNAPCSEEGLFFFCSGLGDATEALPWDFRRPRGWTMSLGPFLKHRFEWEMGQIRVETNGVRVKYIYIYKYTYTSEYVHIYIYICTYIYMYIYICIYIYMYIYSSRKKHTRVSIYLRFFNLGIYWEHSRNHWTGRVYIFWAHNKNQYQWCIIVFKIIVIIVIINLRLGCW